MVAGLTTMALAVLLWPATPRIAATRALPIGNGLLLGEPETRPARTGVGFLRWRRLPLAAAGGVGLLVGTAAGLPAGIAAALMTSTLTSLIRTEIRLVRRRRELAGALQVVRMLARELRSGSSAGNAVAAVGRAASGAAARLVAGLAAMVTVDGPSSLAESGASAGSWDVEPSRALTEIGRRLESGWSLAVRYGVPWAALLDALATDLGARQEADAARAAQVAGPRVSGYVLAILPTLGLLLGYGMGTDPFAVLLGGGVGGLMLVAGVGLTCAGLAWTARIVRP